MITVESYWIPFRLVAAAYPFSKCFQRRLYLISLFIAYWIRNDWSFTEFQSILSTAVLHLNDVVFVFFLNIILQFVMTLIQFNSYVIEKSNFKMHNLVLIEAVVSGMYGFYRQSTLGMGQTNER